MRRSKHSAVHQVETTDGIAVAPDPVSVTIAEDRGYYYLLREDGDMRCVTDTWHESLERAMTQAEFEYELEAWREIDD